MRASATRAGGLAVISATDVDSQARLKVRAKALPAMHRASMQECSSEIIGYNSVAFHPNVGCAGRALGDSEGYKWKTCSPFYRSGSAGGGNESCAESQSLMRAERSRTDAV